MNEQRKTPVQEAALQATPEEVERSKENIRVFVDKYGEIKKLPYDELAKGLLSLRMSELETLNNLLDIILKNKA